MASSVVGAFAHQSLGDDPCALERRVRVHFVIQKQVQRTFERSLRAGRTGADEQCLPTKLLDHLKRLLKFSLQRQDPCAAQRDQALRIDSRWHRSQFFFGNANVSFPSDRQLRFRDQRSYRQLQNFVWTYSYSRDSRGPSCSLGQAQRPFPSSPLIPPTSPDAAGSRRSPCRPGLHLVDRVSRSRIRPGHVRNLDRRSNKKNREPDALREDPVAIAKLCWQRCALFHAVLAADRSCDMPSFRPWRGQRKRRRSFARASLLVRKAPRLSTKCRETGPFDWRNRAPERRADRR